ncbi:MAG TPA: hypothetical protein ENJ46_00875, partial [Hellea balneolensis]|nr:hypothetical protein [Hellea balneolensis]
YAQNGNVLYTRKDTAKTRIIKRDDLGQLNLMLRGVVNNGTGKRARLQGRDIAGKTGTTNDYRDAWFVGYTPDFVTGLWVGNDDNSKMARVTGGTLPARIWKTYMASALKHHPKSRLPIAAKPIYTRPIHVEHSSATFQITNR